MFWLAGAGEVVVLARKENDLGDHAEMLERAKPLLALFDWHTIVVIGMQNQRRRFDVLRVLKWRAIPVEFVSLKYVPSEIRAVAIGAVARAIVRNKIRNAAQGDGGFETIRMADN